MLRARLLVAVALAVAAPAAHAQTADGPIAAIGVWAGKFAAANAEPSAATADCGPRITAALAALRDAASARAVLVQVRPCSVRVRAAYQRLAEALDRLPPLPDDVEAAAKFDSRAFLAEQRRLVGATIAYVDNIERFIGAAAAGDGAAAARLHREIRPDGAALVDSAILQLRVFQSAAGFEATKAALELRIIMAEAGKLLITAPVSRAGVAAGSGLNSLAARATSTAGALRTGWQNDRARLNDLKGSAPHKELDGVMAAADPLVAAIAVQGEQLAAALRKAGAQQVLPFEATGVLATELSGIEAAMILAAQKFATTLQTIG